MKIGEKQVHSPYFHSPLFSFFRRLSALTFLLVLLSVATGLAQQSRVDQLSDDDIFEFFRQAQASGLSEMQIEQAALSQGYTLTDIAKMRQRLSKLQSQQSGQNRQGRNGQSYANDTLRRQLGNLSQRSYLSDSLRFLPQKKDTLPPIFGASLFQGANLTFEPDLRIATPRNYQIGPDDELSVEIYGNASDNFRLRVTPEGSVRLLNLGPVFVNGLTVEQAEQRIVGRLRQSGYQGLNRPGSGVYASVTLGNIRSIRVTLVGEVVKPGTYTISSLATAFNALYLAGGPNPETGSFRDIRIIRNNRVIRTIDLYDFLLRADQKDNIRLQDQDVIRINDFNARVELAGEVKRPAIYEIKSGETLKTVLAFAGGFTDRAYSASITLRRNTARELRISTIKPEEFATFTPQAGDKYTIGRILNRYENRVTISGAVMRPGEYALGADISTVRGLINRAEGVTKDVFPNRAVLYRERDNADVETIPFDLGKLLKNEAEDIPLIRQDSVHVYSIRDLREAFFVTIQGAVNKPDTFQFFNNMGVTDLVALAGGFLEGATPTGVEVARRIREDTTSKAGRETVQLFKFDLDRNLQLTNDGKATQFVLQPFDIVYVRTSSRYEYQQNAYIYGEVNHPGNYAIQNRTERIADLIQRAGGLKPEAFLEGARFSRRREFIATDLQRIINNPNIEGNLLLEDSDTLFIPKKLETVRIIGAVLNPSAVSFEREFNFKNYVTQAGGFTDNARHKRAYVVYANGMKDRTKKFLFFTHRPRVSPGSTIVVPFRPFGDRRLSPGERIGIYSVVATLAVTLTTVVINLTRSF